MMLNKKQTNKKKILKNLNAYLTFKYTPSNCCLEI